MANSFFMVFVEGEQTPVYKHQDIDSAEAEAKRLSKITNKKSFVLLAIKSFELNEFKVTDLVKFNDSDLPF